MVLLDSILVKFCISIHKKYWPIIFFLVISLSGFDIKIILVSKNIMSLIECIEKYFLFLFFLDEFVTIGIQS